LGIDNGVRKFKRTFHQLQALELSNGLESVFLHDKLVRVVEKKQKHQLANHVLERMRLKLQQVAQQQLAKHSET
jgi:hypothetical protein